MRARPGHPVWELVSPRTPMPANHWINGQQRNDQRIMEPFAPTQSTTRHQLPGP